MAKKAGIEPGSGPAAHKRAGSSVKSSTRASALEVASNINKIAAIESSQRAKRTAGEKVAEVIARFCGSMIFVYFHVVWFVGWIFVNSFTLRFRFDPFPYTFLTLVVSLEAIFLSTFILISQNHETRLTERRNHLDLQVNLLAEQESTKTLELLQLVAKKVGVSTDEEISKALLEPIDPEKLVKEIIAVSDSSTVGKAVERATE